MSDSSEIVLTFSVLSCKAEQFMSESAEILTFTQSNSLQRIIQLSDAFRQVCSAEQGQIFSLGKFYKQLSSLKIHKLKNKMNPKDNNNKMGFKAW